MTTMTTKVALLAVLTIVTPSGGADAKGWVIGNDAVVNVKVGSDDDPIPASLPQALAQSIALQKAHPKASQWLVNIDWPSAPTGVQFILKGSTARFDGQTPEAWIERFSFDGGSEKGVIEAGRWCRRGGRRKPIPRSAPASTSPSRAGTFGARSTGRALTSRINSAYCGIIP